MEQFRRYTEKMQNIKELEYAETLAIHQLQLKRQNTVRVHQGAYPRRVEHKSWLQMMLKGTAHI